MAQWQLEASVVIDRGITHSLVPLQLSEALGDMQLAAWVLFFSLSVVAAAWPQQLHAS